MGKREKKIILFLGDLILLYFSLFLILLIRFSNNFNFEILKQHFFPFSFLYVFWILVFYIFDLYDTSSLKSTALRILGSLTINFILSTLFFYFLPFLGITPKTNLILNVFVFGSLSFSWRALFYYLFSIKFFKKITILGKGKRVEILKEEIEKKGFLGYKLVSINEDPEIIIFTKEMEADPNFLKSIDDFLLKKVILLDLETAYEEILEKIPVTEISKIWFLKKLKEGQKRIYDKVKRIFDLAFSLLILILTFWLWPLIALAIKIEDRGPVFYIQERVGKNKKIFKLIKFRSMTVGAEKNEAKWAEEKDRRVTKIGAFLRRTHLDELPQMINVLKGDISLVGPRPERPEFVKKLEKQIPYYHLRHIIKPGFTGWAQIKFRYARSVMDSFEKFQYDLYYIKNRSIFLDLGILLKTFQLLFKRE
jgi:exopolysaccharide biosynthesis polyprenyl glycosylphosphotransferase